MKKIVRSFFACVMCGFVIASFSSCDMISNIKERARLANELVILDSPDEALLDDEFSLALSRGLENCADVSENVTFKVNKPALSSENEDASLDILSSCADMLKKLITENSPGSSSRELSAGDVSDTLLKDVDLADVSSALCERNTRDVAVTDENGRETQDEEGNVIRESVVSDNVLTIVFKFYAENTYVEADDNGEEREVTEIVPCDRGIIEKYFGEPLEKATLLSQFDAVKDYLQVSDYNIEYTDCRVKAKTDLDADELLSVTYEKNFKVTASVTGAGPLSSYGDFTVSFTCGETTEYTFNYPQIEE